MNVLLRRQPKGALARHVASLWVMSASVAGDTLVRLPTARSHVGWVLPGRCGAVQVERPDGGVPLRLDGPLLCVPHQTPLAISFLATGPKWFVGAEFTPGGHLAFTRVPLQGTGWAVRPLALDWGDAQVHAVTQRLAEALAHSPAEVLDTLEALLEAQRRAMDDGATSIQQVLAVLAAAAADPDGGDVVSEAALRLGMSQRQLRALVRQGTGLPTKRYARLLRFARALHGMRQPVPVHYTALAAECGYFDQAHFNHEFKALCGMTPGDYLRMHRDQPHSGCIFSALRNRLATLPWWRGSGVPAAPASRDVVSHPG